MTEVERVANGALANNQDMVEQSTYYTLPDVPTPARKIRFEKATSFATDRCVEFEKLLVWVRARRAQLTEDYEASEWVLTEQSKLPPQGPWVGPVRECERCQVQHDPRLLPCSP